MPLPQVQSKIPTAIGDIIVTLTDRVAIGNQSAGKKARFEVRVLNGDDDVMRVVSGDLEPHLTNAHKNALLGFLDDLRTKAEQEILP